MIYKSHYDYLDANFKAFVNELPVSDFWKETCAGVIVGDGDKCYGYRDTWEAAGISFNRGAAIYLISKMTPYAATVRNTDDGWVPVDEWVILMYPKLKEIFDRIEV